MRITSKWIKDLNVRPETIKLPEGNMRKELLDLNLTIFFYMILKVWETKAKLKWNYIKLKS